jgi:hypothetical protein
MTSRARFHPLVAAAILTLAACGGGEANTTNMADNAAATGNEAVNQAAAPAEATPATAPATAAGLSADYMVGKWSAIGEDCSETLEFRKDGMVTTPIGDAKWTLNGDQLAIDYGDGSKIQPSSIKALGPDRIEITTASGRKETEKRC